MSARRDSYARLATLKASQTTRQSSSQIKLISHHHRSPTIDHKHRRAHQPMSGLSTGSGKLRKLIRWSLVHLCLPLCLLTLLIVTPEYSQAGTLEATPPRLKRTSLLMPISELRISGSKLEPPSRPSVDWSKQRPYFGPNIERNLSVELGKTAHLACKVFELGDKTVSWLRPRENEILTAGKYTYIGDSRISSMNEPGSHDWILEIKDVGLNDSTSYECQVSTDPKMSLIINLHVQEPRNRLSNQAQSLKDSQRNRQQQHGLVISNSLELSDQANQVHGSSNTTTSTTKTMTMPTFVILLLGLLLSCLQFKPTQHSVATATTTTTTTLFC